MIFSLESKNLIFLLFEKLIQLFIALSVLFLIADHFGPEKYGSYDYTFSLVGLFAILNQFLDVRIIKSQFHKYPVKYVYRSLISLRIIFAVLMIVFGSLYEVYNDTLDTCLFYILLSAVVVESFAINERAYLEYKLLAKYLFWGNLFGGIIYVLGLISIKYLGLSIIWAALMYFVMSLLKMLIWLFFRTKIQSEIVGSSKNTYEIMRPLLRQSFPLAIAAASSMLYSRVDRLMIAELMDIRSVGIYGFAAQLNSFLIVLITPFQSTVFPKMLTLRETDTREYYHEYRKYTEINTLVGVGMYLLSIIILSVTFDYIFGKEYAQSYYIFVVYGLGSLFMYNAFLRSMHLALFDLGKILLISQLTGLLINVLFNVLLIPIWELYGAAISSVISIFMSLFMFNFVLAKTRPIASIQLTAFQKILFFRWRRIILK